MTDTRRYVRVEPARERVEPADLVSRLAGLRKLRNDWRTKYDPRKSPPTFEFLALSRGEDAPVRFYLGVDDTDLLPVIESELQTAYPESYEISQESVDLSAALCGEATDVTGPPNADEEPAEGGAAEDPDLSLSDRTPLAARWQGVGERSRDWMTPLTQYSSVHPESSGDDSPSRAPLATAIERLTDATAPTVLQVLFTRYSNWQKGAESRKKQIETKHDGFLQSAKTSLVDLVYGADEERIRDRRRGRDPPRVGESAQPTSSAGSGEVASRQALIDQKGPSKTFTVNLRAVSVLPPDPDDDLEAQATTTIETLANAFNHLDGYFYSLEGSRVTEGLTDIRDPAQKTLERLVTRSFTQSFRGKRRSQLVLNADELANFVAVPSAQALTTQGSRGARGKERLRQPLPLPNPDLLDAFSGPGMTIGNPLRNLNDPLDEPVSIPPELLTTHYMRVGASGSGKSVATQTDMLSLHEHVPGPTVLFDGKGDGMPENYMRAHYKRFGTLDDVYYFDAPETLPAVSLFDIRPALAMGRSRDKAIQDKVDHFHEIMRLILGEERHDDAFVSKNVLTFLIKALFDEEYGADAFSLETLIEAVERMSSDRMLPEVHRENDHVARALLQKCQLDESEFQNIMGGAANRLNKLVEYEPVYQMLNQVPEWDSDAQEYVGNAFDFREFVEEDAVLLFDLGQLHTESERALTMILLSNLWDAVGNRRGSGQSLQGGQPAIDPSAGDPMVNLIIEEASPIVTTSLMYEEFIPQGRSFGVSLGLLLQFPEQVADLSTGDRPYTELLNNVETKLVGKISTDDRLAEAMAYEGMSPTEFRNRTTRLPKGEWIVQLPDPWFGKTGPPPFSLFSRPVPPGHPESENPLSDDERHLFLEQAIPRVRRRTNTECSLPGQSWQLTRDVAETILGDIGADPDEIAAADANERTADSGTAGDGEAPDAPFFGADSTSDDTGAVTDGSGSGADTDSDSASNAERDIGSPPQFGAAGDDSPAAGPEQPDTPSESAPTAPQEDTNETVASNPDDQRDEATADATRFTEATAEIPDATLREEGITRDEAAFLGLVLDAMNHQLEGYSLREGMTDFDDPFSDLDLERLTEKGFLEEHLSFRQKYYTVLPDGRAFLDRSLDCSPGVGDLGEKTPHKAGVVFLESWLHQQHEAVERTERYFAHDTDAVFDVAAFDADDDLCWVGEVETQSNNFEAVRSDYEKLANVDAQAVWVFENRALCVEVLEGLVDAGRIELSLTAKQKQTVSALRAAITDHDLAGMTALNTFRSLKTEVDQDS
ncbi:hypothetical protein BV210_18360 (plasmid) [Halorientalis sp. IM1011]|uniref:hypothetical protein n=1 Tax=Halorientalis sp. IM1011 TaxID=1932360 RepID=UPI00097CD07A|nr:hypothetical protein [Halorientalis sp. IM1011]AQL44718.1 hypothetical protein BV210_18360 [Halorientalis sp. IM1011]